MRILYLSQYFPPEAGATQTRAYEMARNWVRAGHQVTMLTEFPNHPSGIIPASYRGKWFEITELDAIQVIRVWVAASPNKTFRNRMLFYLTFMINAVLAGIFLTRGRFDFLYATSPPLFVGAAALALSWLRRIPMIFEVRDLWPESAVALGELKAKSAIKLATHLEEACYHRAKAIITVTEGIQKRLVERNIQPNKILKIPNGANTDLFFFDYETREKTRLAYGWENRFVTMYAGIHGLAQGLEVMVEAARMMEQNPDFLFVLIGDGPRKSEVKNLADQYDLKNVLFLNEQPREEMPSLLSSADAVLIPLRNLEIFKGALPSKLFDAWSCERPILLSVDGEARELLESCAGGWFVPPENVPALVDAIVRISKKPEKERLEMGRRGKQLTATQYSRQAQAVKLIKYLEILIEKPEKS